MDAAVKQMVEGMRMGVDAQAGNVGDADLLKRAYAVIEKLETLAAEGHDVSAFQREAQSRGLMNEYGLIMGELATAQTAGLEQRIEDAEKMAEELEPVDLKTLDITDLSIITKPHRMIYDTQVKGKPNAPHQQAAYEAFFALADECSTIPEFNRRSLEEGHQHHLGLSATWDANLQSFKLEVEHQQPEMITWALDALEMTRDHPGPETISYALTGLAMANERGMARRRNGILPFTCFTDALAEYLLWPHMHTEEQRQKILHLLEYSREMTGWEIDEAFYRPYVRRRTESGQDVISKKQGQDYLGLTPMLRAGWHLDAKYSPEEKKAFKSMSDIPAPDPLPYPYRTGPVGGVELVLSRPAFALPFDEAYIVRLTITNHSSEARELDVAKGLRYWLFDETGEPAVNRVPVELPAELAPGASHVVEGDLYDWGLTKKEGLRLTAFDVGVVGDHGCDLAEKYADPQQLSAFTLADHILRPFDGGAATAPAFVMPHRPAPDYPFPRPLTGL